MKIAIIISRIDNLGPVKVMSNIVNSISNAEDIEISVFFLDEKVNDQIKLNAPVSRLKRNDFRFNDFDIIHTSGFRPDLFAFLHRKKIRYHISTIHNFVFEDLAFTYNKIISWFFGYFWLIILNSSDRLVCVSAAVKDYYSRWFDSEKLVVIHNGIAESDNSGSADINITGVIDRFHSENLTVLGFAGILTRRKGVDQILHLLSLEKDLAFVAIGDGKEISALKKEAARLNVLDRCFFPGFMDDAISYFRYFDVFVMPSRSEGFGLALIEAIQQRVPVVCSDLKVFQELLNESEVYHFKLDDLQSLSEAVKGAVSDKCSGKTDLAHIRYRNNYTSELMADRYFDLYQSVVSVN